MLGNLSRNSVSRTTYIVSIAAILVVAFIGYQLGSKLMSAVSPASQIEPTQGGVATVSPPYLLPDFTLMSHTGEPVSLSDFRGRSVLLFFGYTHCPDVCPSTLADYKRVKEALGTEANDTAFIFISVDGRRDTPEVMAQYLAQFDTDFIGLTGGEETMRQIGTDYGVDFTADHVNVGHSHEGHDDAHHSHDDEGYFVEHTSPSYLVDPQGYLRLVYFYGTKPDAMTAGIRQILAEPVS